MTLTIAIDARAAAEVPAGRGRFVRDLVGTLAARDDDHRYELLCRTPGPIHGTLDERFTWVAMPEPDPLWHLHAARRASRTSDVLLSTNSYLTAWFTTIPTAVVVHDLMPWIPGAAAQRRATVIEKATIRPAIRNAEAFVCMSHATERDLNRLFPQTAGRSVAVPTSVAARFHERHAPEAIAAARARHDLPERFVLGVGTLEPRKNLIRLIDAYRELPEALRREVPLALVGPKGWEADDIERRAGAAGVRTLGFVEDEDLLLLYAGCAAFAYPSLYEGFGLPPLEAMAAGAPTLTSTTSAMPEVAGDAAIQVDPLDVGAICAGLERLLTDEATAARLREAGPRQARTFSWEKTAAGYVEVLRRLGRAAA